MEGSIIMRTVPRRSARIRRLTLAVATLVPIATLAMQVDASAGPVVDLSRSTAIEQSFVDQVGATTIANQNDLETLRDWMSGQPGFAGSGYVGAVDDLAHRATTILWSGPRTPLLAATIAEGARRGLKVTVRARSDSLRQLDAATQQIWAQAAAGLWAGFTISTIDEVGAVDNGLTVNGSYTSVPAAQRAAQVRSLATTVAGVPVRIIAGVRTIDTSGRDSDIAPFYAGDYMVSQTTGATCSTGFAISINGVTHITTARHCWQNDFKDRDPSASSQYGVGIENSTNGGGRVLSASGDPDALVGAYTSDNPYAVIGYSRLVLNDYVCTEGGNSGEHCNLKVTNTDVSYNDGYGNPFWTIEAAQQSNGAIANMMGDSGGPVIDLWNTSTGQVRAAGMIQGSDGTYMTGSACGPAYDYGTNECFQDVFFSPMYEVVNSIPGASLLIG
jgi:hypothetical protein